MFNKREAVSLATPTVVPDEMLDKVAGGAKPTFYQELGPEGLTCRNSRAPLLDGKFTIIYEDGTPKTCTP